MASEIFIVGANNTTDLKQVITQNSPIKVEIKKEYAVKYIIGIDRQIDFFYTDTLTK